MDGIFFPDYAYPFLWISPLIGFGGYLPFGVECAAVTAWIEPKLVGRR